MAEIRLENIVKKFKDDVVVNNINLTIKDGSFTVIVGPSGCGKSTTLRMIAGLEQPTSGDIWIDGECVTHTPAGKRNSAMVFQNYALYPTMTVRKNIEFGLVNNKVPKAERQKLIAEISEIVGLTEYLDKKPQNLSGGQRQRVALARAMVKKPKVFILDEPLSNLDAKLRGQMRRELIHLHKRLGTTFIYVTHDQVEAMSMGDEIIILNKGEVQQVDSPMSIYYDPNNIFTAEFIGTPAMNVLKYDEMKHLLPAFNKDVSYIGFKPEQATFTTTLIENPHQFTLLSKVITVETLGSETIYTIENKAGLMNVKSFIDPMLDISQIYVNIPYEKFYFFGEEGNRVRSVAIDDFALAHEHELVGGI